MKFSINFVDSPVIYPFDDSSTPAMEGFLEMEGGREYFLSSLYEWSADDYRTQWHDALIKLFNGEERVGLITSYVSPENSSYLNWWILYRCKDDVIIQNQVLFYDQLPSEFSLDKLQSYISPRIIDGSSQGVSEWFVSIFDVQEFLMSFRLG